jgi:aspartate/methionine/tyrosine aminotransferase
MFFPKGIVAQSAEAANKASLFNATVGMALEAGQPLMLPSLQKLIPGLTSREAVAYAPTGGFPVLRGLWKEQLLAKNPSINSAEDLSHPMIVPGLTAGIFQAAELFLDPGDLVLIPDMFWGNYRLIIEGRKEASIQGFPFFSSQGGFNLQAFSQSLNEAVGKVKKLMVILNFPNNPSGYSPTKQESAAIVQALTAVADKGLDILVVTDDAYFGLFYEPTCETESIFAKLVKVHPRILAMKIDGATKEDLVWGFRVGFVTFGSRDMTQPQYEALLQKLMGSIRSSVSSSPGISQHLLIKTLQSPEYAKDKASFEKIMQQRYTAVRGVIDSPQGQEARVHLEPLPFNSGYFMSFRCKGFSAEALRLALLDQGVGTISIAGEFLRIAFSSIDAKDIPTLYDKIFTTAAGLAQGSLGSSTPENQG